MKLKKKITVLGLFGLFLIMTFGGTNFIGITKENSAINEEGSEENHFGDEIKPKKADFWNVNFIHINNDNWSATDIEWIQNRTGTWDDPHFIENVSIDATGRAWGILIEDSDDYFIIRNCSIFNTGISTGSGALILKNTKNGQLIGNNISNNNENGIWLENYCENIEVVENNVDFNAQNGIRVYESCINNTFSYNTLINNSVWGLRFQYRCINNTIAYNNASRNMRNGFYIGDDCDDNLIENNIANNNGLHGIRIDRKCDNNTIKNNIANSNQNGIYIEGGVGNECYNNLVLENHLEGNTKYGIHINDNIHNTTIYGNTILLSGDHGIYTSNGCNFDNITKNTISFGSKNGVEFAGFKNGTFTYNRLEGNGEDGLRVTSNSGDNLIYGNLFKDNIMRGIDIRSGAGSDNLIYMNSFINNLLSHAKDEKAPGENSWDDGVYGNYWDNHTSPDANNDHFVDAPYDWIQGTTDVDSHPLTNSTVHIGERIHIDETGLSAWNWSITAEFKIWCSGSGTYEYPYLIDGLEIDGKGTGSCVLIGNSSVYFIIRDCILLNSGVGETDDNDAGIKLNNVRNGTIINNNCSENNYFGISLANGCENITITNNNCTNNGYAGINVGTYSSENNITNNNVISNPYGIRLFFVSNNYIFNNTANDNGVGIYIHCSDDNTILNNTASETSGGSSQNYGIYIFGNADYLKSTGNNVTGNICNDNYNYGIFLQNNAEENNIINNTVNNNAFDGIRLQNECHQNNITKNTCNGNSHYGIYLLGNCDSNYIIDNAAYYNGKAGINFEGHAVFGNPNDNLISENMIFDNNDYGIRLIVNSSNNHLMNNIIKERSGTSYTQFYGISVSLSSNYNNITGNTLSGHAQPGHAGIYVNDTCGYNNISDNTVFGNYFGIYLHSECDNNTIHSNTVINNLNASVYLEDDCNLNNFSANTFNSSKYGIIINDYCQNNNFMGNVIGNNTIVGVYISSADGGFSDGNLFYGNFFLNNTKHAWDDPAQNHWYSPTHELGNYWDDYMGNDADDNGIGDTYYDIFNSTGDVVNEDRYPIWEDGQDIFPAPPPENGGGDDDDDDDEQVEIPFGNFYLIFLAIGIVGLIFFKKRKIK